MSGKFLFDQMTCERTSDDNIYRRAGHRSSLPDINTKQTVLAGSECSESSGFHVCVRLIFVVR